MLAKISVAKKMSFKLVMFLLSLLLPKLGLGCSSGSIADDSEIVSDPTFTFTVSPPVGWTSYPHISTGTGTTQQIAYYFPGQSPSLEEALSVATNEVTASLLLAFNQEAISSIGVTITVTYTPEEISNCYISQAIPAGTKVGFMAAEAITAVATVIGTAGAGVTLTQCPLSDASTTTGLGPLTEYDRDLTVVIRGMTLTRLQWRQLANDMTSNLNLQYHAVFRSPVTVSRR